MVVYKITNKINNKIYIGKTTKTIEERLQKHLSEAIYEEKSELRNLTKFHKDLLLYGINNFEIEKIEEVNSIEELNKKEDYWIKELNSLNDKIGYNQMTGGQSGLKKEETKRLISEKKKQNWQDEELAEKMLTGLKKATEAWQEICEEKRIEIKCEACGRIFKVPPYLKENRKYCSQQCAGSINALKASKVAAEKNREKSEKRHLVFYEQALQWANENKELILNCKENKISTTLFELQNIAKGFGFSDWRVISKSICGSKSKKELLKYLKQKCENIC